MATRLTVNQRVRDVEAAPDTPLLYVLINELELHGPRFGCGLAQCGSCSVLMDGVEIRSCVTPVGIVSGKSITTFEGLPAWYAEQRKLTTIPELHPLQQAVIDEQVEVEIFLLHEEPNEELVEPGEQVPIEKSQIVADGVIAVVGEFDRLALALAEPVTLHSAAEDLPRN